MTETQMRREINEIPDVLTRQIEQGLPQYLEAGRRAAVVKDYRLTSVASLGPSA